MISERVCKSQQCLRNVWRLKPLTHLHLKIERINKTYFGFSIPTPHSKITKSVSVPFRAEGEGILEACEALLLPESNTGTGASLDTCGVNLTQPGSPRQCRTGVVSGWSALVLGEKKHIAHQYWAAYLGWHLQHCLETPFQSMRLVELCSGEGPGTSLSGLVFPVTIFHSIMNSQREPCRVFLKILYYHGAIYPHEPGFGFGKVGVGTKQGGEARLGAMCACMQTYFLLDLVCICWGSFHFL